ncbi:hypothetical protein GOBAR_DD32367 [Gossypium barbadense]|nr:hypothetical protein GOBAR_DD32367 [Gossypium barbadense]
MSAVSSKTFGLSGRTYSDIPVMLPLLKHEGCHGCSIMSAGVSSPNFSSPAPWQQQVLAQLDLDGEPPNLKRYDLNILKPSSTGTSLGIAKSSCFLHCYCSGAKILDDESIETRCFHLTEILKLRSSKETTA